MGQVTYQKSELTGQSNHFENEIGFAREFLLKTFHCHYWLDRPDKVKVVTGLGWLAGSRSICLNNLYY